MGITSNCATFLKSVSKKGVDFSTTVMLGRQQLYIEPEMLSKLFTPAESEKMASSKYAEPFFQALGAKRVDSLDYSDYEQAQLICDLNKPISDNLKNSYTVVFDGGTLEHVFNFPVAIKNCMDLLQVGGYFITVTPCNNQCGHGFFQFSPELFYSVFSQDHGFKVMIMYLAIDTSTNDREWYEVADPKIVKSRVVFRNSRPTYLMVVAQKQFDFKGELKAYQSDYQELWSSTNVVDAPAGKLVRFYRAIVPVFVRARIYRLRQGRKEIFTKGLGNVNAEHFKRVIID